MHNKALTNGFEKGETARIEHAYPEAIKYFEWAMRKESDPRPFIGLGKCYRSIGDYKKAAKFFGEAVKLSKYSTRHLLLPCPKPPKHRE